VRKKPKRNPTVEPAALPFGSRFPEDLYDGAVLLYRARPSGVRRSFRLRLANAVTPLKRTQFLLVNVDG